MKKQLTTTIASQIFEKEVAAGLRVFVMPTSVERMVRIEGSLLGGDCMSLPGNPLRAELTAAMLDQGTKNRDKKTLHDLLDSRGVSITFDTSAFRLDFSAVCLSEDFALTVELLGDMLQNPTFPETELKTLKKRLIGKIRERASNTRFRAQSELAQNLFPKWHPNYTPSTEEEISSAEKITRKDLVSFHGELGLGEMYLVTVGDIDALRCEKEVTKRFGSWKTTSYTMPKISLGKSPGSKKVVLKMKDKTSADVVLGLPLPFGNHHNDFYPLVLGNAILGGGFTARLVQEVREKRGLTYGTYSYVRGTANDTPGFWFAWATFAPALLAKGQKVLEDELKKFIAKGVTQKELETRKEALIGSYQVGLITTSGLAHTILSAVEEKRGTTFLDEYPKMIEKITLAQVNQAIKEHLSVNNLITVIAGSVD